MKNIVPNPSTFCAVPFVNIRNATNGEWGTFCDGVTGTTNVPTTEKLSKVWNIDFYKQLRLDSINGVKNKTCDFCWRNESTGNFSMRKSESACFNIDDILPYVNDDGSMTIAPQILDIKLSNICNAKCIMCCQIFSSQHENEVKFWKKSDIKLPSALEYIESVYAYNNDYRVDSINIDNFDLIDEVKKIRIAGGEPMINPKVKELLNKINNIDVDIEIITNLSEIDFHLLSRFKNLHITGSIDHINESKFNFIRFPLNFDICINNFKQITHTKEISFSASIFNIMDLREIFDYFETLNTPISFNYVLDPNYWSIHYLEPEQKEYIIEMVQQMINDKHKIIEENNGINKYMHSIHKMLSTTPDDFTEIVKERTRVLKLYDTSRKTDYKTLYPFIKDYE